MRSSLGIAVLAGLALLAAAPAQADWKKDYDRGLKAVESGQWAEAESAFRAALAEDPQPNARKRFQGVVLKLYVPHYYAGLAAYRRGNCSDAMALWQHGPTNAVLATQDELLATKRKGEADCTQKLAAAAKPAAPVAATTTPTETPKPTAGTTTTQPSTPPVTPPKTPASTPMAPVAQVPKPAAPKPEAPAATPAAAPAPLVTAVEAYLAGRYATVTQFDPAALADGRARAQGFLLRAASRYTLAQLAEGDAAQLEQARRDVRAARSANAALTPDEAAFSPRFRAFWRETR